ncbi:MAG: type II secretion system protein, partial [bacterium]|nr:type II secretion system protein [bacterium]
GFTLIELLIVISIISVLVTVGLVSFRSSQMRGRDVQRKSDLKQIANSLEIFYSDYRKYPASIGGQLSACPYNSGSASGTACSWGSSEFTDSRNIYFKVMPKDPSTGYFYYYRILDSPSNQKYQLFARVENTEDKNCINGNCVSPVTYSCGVKTCNFAITSTNTKATE